MCISKANEFILLGEQLVNILNTVSVENSCVHLGGFQGHALVCLSVPHV